MTAPAGLAAHELRIGEWILDPERNELRRNADSVRQEPKSIEVLVQLSRRAGPVVSRDDLLSLVWPGVVVGDDALTQAIIKLRKVLADDAQSPTYIETIPKRGYRLVAPVISPDGESSRPSPPRSRRALLATVAVAAVVLAGLVAVLPLANQSGDRSRDYLSDGLTEDITNALGSFSGLRVMSRHAVQPYRDRSPPLDAIRRELLVQVGNLDEARRAAESVRRINPDFRTDDAGTRFHNPERAARLREGLAKAGL